MGAQEEHPEVDSRCNEFVRLQVDRRLAAHRELARRLAAVEGSAIWRITKPLRKLSRRLAARGQKLREATIRSAVEIRGGAGFAITDRMISATAHSIKKVRRSAFYARWRALRPYRAAARLPAAGGDRPVPLSSQPAVSVVIPVKDKLEYTQACLRSIAEHPPESAIEILVVDDGSGDGTAAELGRRADLRYLRNPENLGFVGSCNRGAAEARGEFLYFLNNDTVVLPGWLDWLVRTARECPDAGLVGSKLVYPGGVLQEAGGIIWRDGGGCNWGRGGDPTAPEYNYLRDVDYVSGAAILVPRERFEAVGGFSAEYAPAYYEDTDLAFKLREAGHRVLYQPLSEVLHFEGVSCGTDTSYGMKAYQVRNQERFVDRWRQVLERHGRPGGNPAAAADRTARLQALVVDSVVPTPDQDSGSADMWNLLRILRSLGFRVTFFPVHDLRPSDRNRRYIEGLRAEGVECITFPHFRNLKEFVRRRGAEFDLAVLTREPVASKRFRDVRRHYPLARIVFNTVDLHYLREQRRAELEGDPERARRAEEMKARELDLVRRAEATLVVSSFEKELLAREVPGAYVHVLPIIREIPGRRAGFEERCDIVFIGGFRHLPNVDAVQFLARDIWPGIRERLPGVNLYIVGSHVPDEVRSLEGDGLLIKGFVEDLGEVFDRCRLTVAPLRYGAGAKGKVVTSLSYGVPCVATPTAAEGMDLLDGETIAVAEDPDSFAAAVADLYTDPERWERSSNAGVTFVREQFSVESNRLRVADLLARLAG